MSSNLSKSTISVVADEDTVTGFRLGGIDKVHSVSNTEEAEKAINDLINEEVSIIITTEKIGDELRGFIDRVTRNKTLPIIVEIPDKTGPIERKADPIRELVKRAIGIETIK